MRKYLKTLREQAGLNQMQVAEALGVTQAYIAQLEGGRKKQLTAALADRLADLYCVDVRDIIAEESIYGTNQCEGCGG